MTAVAVSQAGARLLFGARAAGAYCPGKQALLTIRRIEP